MRRVGAAQAHPRQPLALPPMSRPTVEGACHEPWALWTEAPVRDAGLLHGGGGRQPEPHPRDPPGPSPSPGKLERVLFSWATCSPPKGLLPARPYGPERGPPLNAWPGPFNHGLALSSQAGLSPGGGVLRA